MSAAPVPQNAPVPENTGLYRTVRSLARGGMGQVDIVLRREGSFQRVYALKRLLGVYAEEPSVRAMFVDEARIAGLIRHANVVSVLDAGEDKDGPFLVMDFVEGVSLSRLLSILHDRGARLPLAIAIDILRQAARGLHAAHELRGPSGVALHVVHRDVSPQNVLVGFDGLVKVTDFGVARALDRVTQTAPGTLKGKAGYMSPEQLRYDELDRRSDLFSLGVVGYELLTQRRLYAGERPATFRRILKEPAPDLREARPELPPAVAELFASLLAKQPADRPATAADVASSLDRALAELSDPGVTLAAYLARELADERREQAHMIEEALAGSLPPMRRPELRAPSAPAPVVERPAPSRAPIIAVGVGAFALLGGALLLALAVLHGGETAPPESAEADATPAPASAAAPPAPGVEAPEPSPAEERPSLEAPPAVEVVPEPVAASAPSRPRRRAPAADVPAPATPTAPTTAAPRTAAPTRPRRPEREGPSFDPVGF